MLALVHRKRGETVARIVVADDDADIRDLVALKLRQSGYDVEAVGDGVSDTGSMVKALAMRWPFPPCPFARAAVVPA